MSSARWVGSEGSARVDDRPICLRRGGSFYSFCYTDVPDRREEDKKIIILWSKRWLVRYLWYGMVCHASSRCFTSFFGESLQCYLLESRSTTVILYTTPYKSIVTPIAHIKIVETTHFDKTMQMSKIFRRSRGLIFLSRGIDVQLAAYIYRN